MFEICETILLLDGCSGVGPVDLSKKVIEMGWKQDEKWDEGGRSDTCKARDRFHAIQVSKFSSIKQYLVLAEIHLDFDS